jgi:hypothetical protein
MQKRTSDIFFRSFWSELAGYSRVASPHYLETSPLTGVVTIRVKLTDKGIMRVERPDHSDRTLAEPIVSN